MLRTVLAFLICLTTSFVCGCGSSYTDADAARDQVQEADALEAETQTGEMDPDEEE